MLWHRGQEVKKKCFKCNKEKDIEEFYRHKEMKEAQQLLQPD